MLAEVAGGRAGSVDSHFFDDLGADSMVMAQFCARVRKRPDLPSVSIKDIYQHPTISSLAAALAPDGRPPAAPRRRAVGAGRPRDRCRRADRGAGTGQHAAVRPVRGAAAPVLPRVLLPRRRDRHPRATTGSPPGSGLVDDLPAVGAVRRRGCSSAVCTLPILAKWVLIGRWKPQQIRIWSLGYVRFWIVKTLVRANPLVLFFAGSPLYVLYLRALGAKIGRGVVIFSRHVPVCTDLLTIGDGTVIRKDSFFSCYRAHAGLIQTGAVTLGKNVFIGETTVLDIETSMGDGAQLGHASSLHTGQAVPAGERWHGSPAQPHRGRLPDGRAQRLRHPAKGRLQRPAAAQRAGRDVPLAIGGAVDPARRVPAARRAAGPGGRRP